MKNKDINLGSIKTKITSYIPFVSRHLTFIVVILVLVVYLFTVFQISQMVSAEPSPEDVSSAEVNSVPKVDQKAINEVLQLENNSPQVHSLFNQARNNPFNE